jgi:hypothetical protein
MHAQRGDAHELENRGRVVGSVVEDAIGDRAEIFSTAPGSSFSFPGVTYCRSVAEMVADFPQRRLADFRLEPPARARYLEKFVGLDDGKASHRFLDVAAALVQPSEGGSGHETTPPTISNGCK